MLNDNERRSTEPAEQGNDHAEAAQPAEGESEPANADRRPSRPNGRMRERRAVAGRKGARRIHELIQRGRLYEQEHGLKRGRQRLRQLIEEGKLYEREHSLDRGEGPAPRPRTPRMSRHQVMMQLVEALIHLAQPGYRPELNRLLESLATARDGRAQSHPTPTSPSASGAPSDAVA